MLNPRAFTSKALLTEKVLLDLFCRMEVRDDSKVKHCWGDVPLAVALP